MDRRTCLTALAALGAGCASPSKAADQAIQLHVDMQTDPARENQLVDAFHSTFEPVIRQQPGFVDVKLLKLRKALKGDAPSGATHRLIISFKTEEQRLVWVATDDHQRVWPKISENLTGFEYSTILYDQV